MKRPVMLCILDGWGLKTGEASDALTQAKLPNFDRLWATMPRTDLAASGLEVGLPKGQIGNSEVGHLNIGAGRVVYQDLTRITKSIEDGDFFENPALLAAMANVTEHRSKLHFFGLLSDGGVHSELDHLKALLRLAKQSGVQEAYVHCFLDGRDVSPTSGVKYLHELTDYMAELGLGQIGTVMGRFYAMDRDKRWDRVERAWRALVLGEGTAVTDGIAAVETSYSEGVTDEFVEPLIVVDADGEFKGRISDRDSIIFYNFRADRAREITRAFYDADFKDFDRPVFPQVHYTCMTEYDITFPLPVAFGKQELKNTLGEYVAACGKRQLRIAETEKYAHVTFFFNGGVEAPNPNEERILIPSPKVQTYDLQPEMSAEEVTQNVLRELAAGQYDMVIQNYANPDMVGHTGIMAAAVKAVEKVDECLGRVVDAVLAQGGVLLVTADHGNVEEMFDANGEPVTAHTTNRVPFMVVGAPEVELSDGGSLQDIAPTILDFMGLEQPAEMTGRSLVK